jgi:hypothetical protein
MDDKQFESFAQKVRPKAQIKPAGKAERDFWAKMRNLRQDLRKQGGDEAL